MAEWLSHAACECKLSMKDWKPRSRRCLGTLQISVGSIPVIVDRRHLDCGIVAFQSDDLANQLVLSHSDELVHSCSTHVVCHHHRP